MFNFIEQMSLSPTLKWLGLSLAPTGVYGYFNFLFAIIWFIVPVREGNNYRIFSNWKVSISVFIFRKAVLVIVIVT